MYIITTVRDRKTEEFRGLALARTSEAARRMFADAILNGEDTMLNQHPEDFFLAVVGTFDEDSGDVEGMDGSWQNLLEATDVLKHQAARSSAARLHEDQIDLEHTITGMKAAYNKANENLQKEAEDTITGIKAAFNKANENLQNEAD